LAIGKLLSDMMDTLMAGIFGGILLAQQTHTSYHLLQAVTISEQKQ